MTHGFQPGVDWDTNEFGPGILDVVALLDAPLTYAKAVPELRGALVRRQSAYSARAKVLERVLRLEMMELDFYSLIDEDIHRNVAALDASDEVLSIRRLRRQLLEQLSAAGASIRLTKVIKGDLRD
jgi:hypothetical protein